MSPTWLGRREKGAGRGGDSGRAAAPLIQAADAHLLDTSEMTIDSAFREALRLVEQMRGS